MDLEGLNPISQGSALKLSRPAHLHQGEKNLYALKRGFGNDNDKGTRDPWKPLYDKGSKVYLLIAAMMDQLSSIHIRA
jgi:hypothetical protein